MLIPPEYLNEIVTGDARVLAERIPDASVDLIFTDPVYERIEDYAWLAETAARVLKPNGHLLAWQETELIPETMCALGLHLVYRRLLISNRSNIAKLSVTIRRDSFSHYVPCLWYSPSRDSKHRIRVRDVIEDPFIVNPGVNHKWAKPIKSTGAWMNSLTGAGALVADFFCGGGTTPAVAKMRGRNYIAFEIDPDTAARARARVAATQAMHPVFLEEQTPMELAAC